MSIFTVLFATATLATAGTISISSPSNGASVGSPIHVVASASSSTTVRTIKIWLDGQVVYTKDGSKLDTYVSASAGSHRVSVGAYDANGSFKKYVDVTVTSTTTSSSTSSTSSTTIPSTAKVFSDIEEMQSWGSCTDCAGGGADALFSMTQHISSPSQDGDATRFWVGGSTPFSHGLWWKWLSSNTSVSHFVLDMYYYIKDPGASQGLEFAANQNSGNKWYKFSTQCSFGSGKWRVWDTANAHWVDTAIACTRPQAYTWTHVVFEYSRANGKANFISITINGTKHYVNKSFYPKSKTASGSVGIHFQLDGNSTQSDYAVWTDNMKLTYW